MLWVYCNTAFHFLGVQRKLLGLKNNIIYLSLTVGASRLIEAQMDLPRLLFGVGFQIFIGTPQMFRFSREHAENVRD